MALSSLRNLAGQTAVYGLGSILGRVLNYLLTPLYTSIFNTEVFGTYTEAYAYIAILLVVLTYGLETALFHFAERQFKPLRVFSTALISLIASTSVFWALLFSNKESVAHFMNHPDHPEYVGWLGLIIGLDALTALPMAFLRQQNRPFRFTGITLANIGVNIGLNLYWLWYCRSHYLATEGNPNALVDLTYNHDIGVGYIFIANLAASCVKALLCLPLLRGIPVYFDWALWKSMMRYALPLLIAGLGFIVNERLDVIMLSKLLPMSEEAARQQVGIYGACYKLAILMTIFIQAFRYAAEPFFFRNQHQGNARSMYARVMNYFVAFCCLLFLGVNLYMDLVKHFIQSEAYWVGLSIVPVIMLANMFLGIYINLSMWYKLSGQTYFGALISIVGALVTVGLNYLLIPYFGYVGSAWTTLFAYGSMMIISYVLGQKYYPIPYNVPRLVVYISVALFLVWTFEQLPQTAMLYRMIFATLFLLPFLAMVWRLESSLRRQILHWIWKK